MKLLQPIITILLVSLIAQIFLPWWIIAIVCFMSCFYYAPTKLNAFILSFLTIFILWFTKAWMADSNFDEPVSVLLGHILGNISGGTVLFLTGITGGLTGGLSGLMGTWTNEHFFKKIL